MQLLLLVCPIAVALAVQLPNPIPLFDVTGAAMNVHDGDIRQWVPGGAYYYYGMAYDRCKFIACGDPTCGHLMDHRVLVWRSATLANRSWEVRTHPRGAGACRGRARTRAAEQGVLCRGIDRAVQLVGDALPGSAGGAYGTLYRPHILFNAPTRLYVLFVNMNTHNGSDDRWRNMVATSSSPEGPFTAVNEMAQLTYGKRNGHNLGDFGVFHDDDGDGYIVYNVMGAGLGIFVERLAAARCMQHAAHGVCCAGYDTSLRVQCVLHCFAWCVAGLY
jgi:hypothetical protein